LPTEKTEHIYFRGLNGLRFFAALAVIVTHIELIKQEFGFENLWHSNPLVFELGGLGVVFFFVLSGFLITYLLLQEKKVTGTIAVKKFYLRRILRIWPLYYLVVILGFFVLTHFQFMDIKFLEMRQQGNFHENLIFYLLFLPNLAFAVYGAFPHIGQTWSIGVEEQFYILWPVLVKHSKNILRALLLVITILILLKAIVLMAWENNPTNPFLKVLKPFLAMTKMESMAIGGLGAYFLFNSPAVKILFNNILLAGCLVITFILPFVTPSVIQNGIYLVYSVIFLIIMMNISSNPNSFLKLENGIFKLLGNISYGIYMYHLMVVAFVVGGLKYLEFKVDNGFVSQLLIYTTSISLSILVSWLSYTYFEKWFLRLKTKFTIIKSGSV
jgi:peptidoglycan/LPS O-acetylase OafA/YrhL